jgi:hypothetical protein
MFAKSSEAWRAPEVAVEVGVLADREVDLVLDQPHQVLAEERNRGAGVHRHPCWVSTLLARMKTIARRARVRDQTN